MNKNTISTSGTSQKLKSKFIRLFAICAVLCMTLLAVLAFAPSRQASATTNFVTPDGSTLSFVYFHGIRLSPNEELKEFYIYLPLTQGEKAHPFIRNSGDASIRRVLETWNRSRHELSALIRFNNLRYPLVNGDPIGFLATIPVELPSSMGNRRVDFLRNIEIGLTQNYYTWITQVSDGDLNNVSIELRIDNGRDIAWAIIDFAVNAWSFGSRVRNYDNFRGVRTGYCWTVASVLDPNSPNFNIDFGNSGTQIISEDTFRYRVPNERTWWQNILDWLSSALGFTVTLSMVLLVIGVIFGSIFLKFFIGSGSS